MSLWPEECLLVHFPNLFEVNVQRMFNPAPLFSQVFRKICFLNPCNSDIWSLFSHKKVPMFSNMLSSEFGMPQIYTLSTRQSRQSLCMFSHNCRKQQQLTYSNQNNNNWNFLPSNYKWKCKVFSVKYCSYYSCKSF